MSANKAYPHVYVLPEDDANRQVAVGFHKEVPVNRQRQMMVLDVARGWRNVLQLFESVHVAEMNRWPERFMVLLFDFDHEQKERLQQADYRIPPGLNERVFILGALNEPEALRPVLGSYETIGSKLARDCRDSGNDTWGNPLLRHNAHELARLRQHVLTILFPPA